jgi:acetoacetate decarboxylase
MPAHPPTARMGYVRSGTNFVADVTLGVGDVVHDYLA